MRYISLHILFVLSIFLISSSVTKKKTVTKEESDKSFHEVIDNYYFVADFRLKPSTRSPLSHYFWKYPIKIQPVSFDLKEIFWSPELFPVTEGEGLIYQHLNRARVFYLDKNFETARKTLLSAKARAESDFKYLKRINYFIALTFLAEIPQLEQVDTKDDEEASEQKDLDIKKHYSNASNFLVNAFYTSSDDPLLQKKRINALYVISGINFRYSSYMYAFKFINLGLEVLAKEGLTTHYMDFLRMKGYILQKAGHYLEAIKVYDLALRQDHITKREAALILTQVANIYFDLNNYELAEDLYEKASLVDIGSFTPLTYVLRGECLFWMNDLDGSSSMLQKSLDSENFSYIPESDHLGKDNFEFASLRLADIYLAKKDVKKASLEYFKLKHMDRYSYYGQIADIREGCLDFNSFEGKNITHIRTMFQEYYDTLTDENLKELSLACLTMSYKDTDEIVEKSKLFLQAYPESDFIESMRLPLIKKQASLINTYFSKGKKEDAIKFFETNRSSLFKNIDNKVRLQLFEAYTDLYSYDKAEEFYPNYIKHVKELKTKDNSYNRALVRIACFLRQIKNSKQYLKDSSWVVKELESVSWSKVVLDNLYESYIDRFVLKHEKKDLGWILSMVEGIDSSKNPEFKCKYIYDVYSLLTDEMSYKELINLGLDKKLEKDFLTLEDLVKSNETCSDKLVDIDKKLYINNLDVLVKKCQSYTFMSKHMAFVCWNIAQSIENKKSSDASLIYKKIIDLAPKDSSELSLSKLLYKGP